MKKERERRQRYAIDLHFNGEEIVGGEARAADWEAGQKETPQQRFNIHIYL